MTSHSSLLQWLATFTLDGQTSIALKNDAYYNLADGLVFAKILNQISPQHFTKEWLSGIEPIPPNGSWAKRVSNLNRILKQISDYASDQQNPQSRLNSISKPDVVVIAQNFDPDQISRIIQFILFCAITCDNKQYYVEKISNLPNQAKYDIKKAIEEVLFIDNIETSANNQHNSSQSANESVKSENDNAAISHSQKYILNSSSPVRSTPHRSLRRDSSQNSVDTSRRNESHLDTSSQNNHNLYGINQEDIIQRLNDALKVKDEKSQACHELELKLRQLQLEKDQLSYENEKLIHEKTSITKHSSSPLKLLDSRRLSQNSSREFGSSADSRDSEDRIKILEEKNRKLLVEVQKSKEELIKVETEKDEYRLNSNFLNEKLNEISLRSKELKEKAEQAQRLQDELDEYKQISEKVSSYETTIDKLKKKNSELSSKLKIVEEKNVIHIRRIAKLEEENPATNTTNCVEIYKKQLQEAQTQLSEANYRAERAEVELVQVTEKYTAAKNENQKLYQTTNQLIRSGGSGASLRKLEENGNLLNKAGYPRNRSFESVDLEKSTNITIDHGAEKPLFEEQVVEVQQNDDLLNSLSGSIVDLKEKIARLEYENENLQSKLSSKREHDHALLNNLLESANARANKSELDNRQFRKKIMLLENHLKDLNNPHNGPSTSGIMVNDSSSDNTLALLNRVEELQRSLFQKEQELMESEAKYKKNLHKAKDVIKTLNSNQSINGSLHPSCMSSTSSFNSSSLDEVNILKQQLKEKHESLIDIEREFHEYKRLKEVHERLFITAFFGLTTPMQWRNAEKRLERTTITSPPNTATSSINHTR